MSITYAEGLSPYEHKGKLGLPEIFDSESELECKVERLADWVRAASHVVVHTGAGISTSAGIPDFRGPRGVWTLEAKGIKPDIDVSFDRAEPTRTHMAILALIQARHVHHVVSQNIDGLHLKSGLSRDRISELHGNMFVARCRLCEKQFVLQGPVPTVGEKSLGEPCPGLKTNGRNCRGQLHDTILDWDAQLPEMDLEMAEMHSNTADLSLCLGTTLQIVPSGNLPTWSKRNGGKLVICNLQATKHDKKADMLIHGYVDSIMSLLMKRLGVEIAQYDPSNDPTRQDVYPPSEWTITSQMIRAAKLICMPADKKRKKVKKVKNEVKTETIVTNECVKHEAIEAANDTDIAVQNGIHATAL